MQPNKPDKPNKPNEQDRLADFFNILLERLVCAIAVRRSLGLLAHAQGNFFLFSYCKLNRLEPGSLVGPVTERLVPRSST
jgi:hypothetical protein